MKRLIFLLILFVAFPSSVFADYTLPYPSYMPGNKLYKASRLFDELQKYWHWGNIASVKYRLKIADKYLVEAKILLEYRQYLLGIDALKRSNAQLPFIQKHLRLTQYDGKDVEKLRETIDRAMDVHVETLEKLAFELPASYQWIPEKQAPTTINFTELLQSAISERKRLLE